jgi:hypothetical protein
MIAALAVLLMVQSAWAGAATSRRQNTQAVLSAFGRSGIPLHVVTIRSRIAPNPYRGVTFMA